MNNDLISREALKKVFENLASDDYNEPIWYQKTVFETIDNAPTVDIPTELCKGCRFLKDCETCEEKLRPIGEWKEWIDERWGGTTIYCPYCKEHALEKYIDGLHRQVKSNFCPNCGAKLKKGGAE